VATIQLTEVTGDNWRACADLEVTAEQQAYVAPVTPRASASKVSL